MQFFQDQIDFRSLCCTVINPSIIPVKIATIGAGLNGPRHAQSVISSPSTELIALDNPMPTGK
ncbi:hypothetical protein PDIG_15370 [Penicillium digitatum PHI26]|uniref:Uncharacterized protein n=2 Tax=Penicillium digitatum TaxID=36651 RepID=K9GS23_PEND2|nr:hypothetical protein PDIP_30900 [Penicillium digitatum Pd1]EKV17413.1 hypothetical protein PDIG_15370 [Penicillium digitatum PHI26]EKV17575.1 hypothetical protein PDIP_30900 [Penicillium digitatum Pd1]